MREFKFRAWDKESKVMRPVTRMDFLEWEVRCDIDSQYIRYSNGERNSFRNEDTDRHIIMQYTGLKDYRDNDIYEGDIVKVNDTFGMEDSYHEVRYMIEGDYPAYDLAGVEAYIESNALQYYLVVGIVEVVGNIYDNWDMLDILKEAKQ